MTRKGTIEEIISKARYADDAALYTITYRDHDVAKEVTLLQFLEDSSNFEIIPATRILVIKKRNRVLFRKSE